jgi:UDP-GlcNAc:undecaprenyl-phosphate GlcNAc-1-phosphate transferase
MVVALGALGLLLAAPCTALLMAWGLRLGALDSAGASGHAKELRSVPNIGGIAIACAVLLPLGLALLAAQILTPERMHSLAPSLSASMDRLPQVLQPAFVIFVGALSMHLIGIWDDRRAIPPLPKLIMQVVVALGTVISADVRVLTLLDSYPGGVGLSVALTTIWVVALCNSINFLDNMDGLAGGVGAIGALSLCIGACIARQWLTAAMLALLVGALCGFLLFNAPWTRGRSARIFMGDGGSLLVGFLLAILAVRIVFVNIDEPNYALGTHWYGVLAPIVILAVPLYDTFMVTVLRVLQGRSPMVGDQQHFSHRLVMRGLSKRGAVAVIWALAGICGVSGLLLGTAAPWQAALLALQVALVIGALAGLERPMLSSLQAGGAKKRDP